MQSTIEYIKSAKEELKSESLLSPVESLLSEKQSEYEKRQNDDTTTGRIMQALKKLCGAWYENAHDAGMTAKSIINLADYIKALQSGDDEAVEKLLKRNTVKYFEGNEAREKQITTDPADEVLCSLGTDRTLREARRNTQFPGRKATMVISVLCACWEDSIFSDCEFIEAMDFTMDYFKYFADNEYHLNHPEESKEICEQMNQKSA